MSGAQNWSVRGIDPKVREAAREAAARRGVSVGEYLNQALAQAESDHDDGGHGGGAYAAFSQNHRARSARIGAAQIEDDDTDWRVHSGPAPRVLDPARLAQRIDAIERRTQLAVAGLDRAVSTIDRSVLGLSARIDDAESVATEAADSISDALEQFRNASEALTARIGAAESGAAKNRDALDAARNDVDSARTRLEAQAAAAEEIAHRAEAAAKFLADEIDKRAADSDQRFATFNARAREELAHGLAQARDAAMAAARDASGASAAAVEELRFMHDALSARLQQAESRIAEGGSEAAEKLRADQSALVARLEKAELSARESTAGLRQAAGAAIADLRNAQLNLAARLKQIEEGGGAQQTAADLKAEQADIAQRLHALEEAQSEGLRLIAERSEDTVEQAVRAFEQKLQDIAERVGDTSAFEQKLQDIAAKVGAGAANDKLNEVDGAVKTLDESLRRLSERIAETETSANTAIRTLEETVSGLSARIEGADAQRETEDLRALLEQRLDEMAQSVSQTVGEARVELADQIQAALGGQDAEGLEGALEDVNRRLAAAERRQAQTIEAISIEIKRMSETVDRRLRAVEEQSGGDTVREELKRMANSLETRFTEIEQREASAFDRMGLEIGKLSERLEERVGAVETRSAQAIEHVGEQVARMAERFNQRHDLLARDLGERMLDSEERAGQRVSEAINSLVQRLNEVEESAVEAVAPVQKVVSDVAARLESLENRSEPFNDPSGRRPGESAPYPVDVTSEALDAFASNPFGASPGASADPRGQAAIPPMQAAQPPRAGPLPPRHQPETDIEAIDNEESDIYFADEEEEFFAHDDADRPKRASSDDLTFELENDDDGLLDDNAFANSDIRTEVRDDAPPPPHQEHAWDDEDEHASAHSGPHQIEDLGDLDDEVFDALDPEPAAPAGKHDYLAAARQAAKDAANPKAKDKAADKKAKPSADAYATPAPYSLRGSSRVVLWGATSAVALLIAGGAWYLSRDGETAEPRPAQALPDLNPIVPAGPMEADPRDTLQDGELRETDPSAPAGGVEGAPEEPESAAAATQQRPVRAAALAPRAVTLEQAAREGDSVAQYELALARLTAGDRDEAISLLRRSADNGLAMAQYRLAKLYERGEGVPTDLTMARQWTERAAAAGNRRAMHDLGVYYARGEGAPMDEAAAFRWFRQAAELGVADSQYNLGVLYQQGRGVSASAPEAMFWFLVASRQGDEDAGARAEALQSSLTAMQVEQAEARANAFRPRAASAAANGQFGARPWAAGG